MIIYIFIHYFLNEIGVFVSGQGNISSPLYCQASKNYNVHCNLTNSYCFNDGSCGAEKGLCHCNTGYASSPLNSSMCSGCVSAPTIIGTGAVLAPTYCQKSSSYSKSCKNGNNCMNNGECTSDHRY